MTVVVFDAVSHFPVSDATIKVTAGVGERHPGRPGTRHLHCRSQPIRMTVPAEEPGDWVFTMVVTSTLGEECWICRWFLFEVNQGFEVDPKIGQVAKRESRSKIGRKQGAGHEANT